MSILTVLLGVSLYVVLGTAWIKGAGYVKKHSPEHLPNFHMILTIIRVISILTVNRIIFNICVRKPTGVCFLCHYDAGYVCTNDDRCVINKTLDECIKHIT